jgi:hypothetical protein
MIMRASSMHRCAKLITSTADFRVATHAGSGLPANVAGLGAVAQGA